MATGRDKVVNVIIIALVVIQVLLVIPFGLYCKEWDDLKNFLRDRESPPMSPPQISRPQGLGDVKSVVDEFERWMQRLILHFCSVEAVIVIQVLNFVVFVVALTFAVWKRSAIGILTAVPLALALLIITLIQLIMCHLVYDSSHDWNRTTDKYFAGAWLGFLFSLPYFALLVALGIMLMLKSPAPSDAQGVVHPEEQSTAESGKGSRIPKSKASSTK
jgi:hypothetical protein